VNVLAALHNDPSVRDDALAQLARYAAEKRLTAGSLFWSETNASVAGALLGGNSVEEWQSHFGLAAWTAYALDSVTNFIAPESAVRIAGEFLAAIALGSDTTGSAVQVILAVLDKLERVSCLSTPAGESLRIALQQIRSMHVHEMRGVALDRAKWKSARKAATAATDSAKDPSLKAIGQCVEAAAWSAATSPAIVGDVLRLWSNFEGTQVEGRSLGDVFGWTEEDDQRVRGLLGEMFETYVKDKPEEKRDVFQLLAIHHPDVEERLRRYTRQEREQKAKALRAAAELLIEVMAGSPV
jgi:hypothetical protein